MFILTAIANSISDDFPEDHIARLKKHNGQSFWIQIALAFTLFITLLSNQAGSMQTLAIWFGILLMIGFIRLGHNSTKRDKFAAPKDRLVKIKTWVAQYIVLTTIMSFLWGTVGFFLFPHDEVLQAIVLTLLIAVLLTTVPLLLASKAAFYVQFVGILAPVIASIFVNYSGGRHFMLVLGLLALATTVIFASNYLYQIILQLQEAKHTLQTLAETDQLTGLANRRSFDLSFKSEWRRCTREKQHISLLVIDVDDFKLYNDTFGHPAGDNCLRRIAESIKENAQRPADLAARIGGEEFCVLLPGTDELGAIKVAENIRKTVNRLDIKNPDENKKNITISIGISSCTPRLQKEEQSDVLYPAMLMKASDRAMYLAKQQGKDQLVVEGCEVSVHPSQKDDNATSNRVVSA